MPSHDRRRHPPARVRRAPRSRLPRDLRKAPFWALLLFALACLLLSTSILTATLATPPAQAPSDAPPSLAAGDVAHVAYHPEKSSPYTAQGLTAARWEVGAIQANWNHRAIWEAPVTGDGTRVAIIDTGVDPDHPDLRDRVVAWRDFVNDRGEAYDDTGHGTHVAGIIAAGGHTQLRPDQGYFLTGARGIAPDVEILAAKAMDGEGRGDPERIAQAIEWALDPDGKEPAHIINLSLGISLPSSGEDEDHPLADHEVFPETRSMKRVRQAVEEATEQGVVVVVAAGNHEPGEDHGILFPGTMDEVITVGAVDPSGRVAAFSNTGRPGDGKPDLVAPGVIVSTSPLIEGSERIARYRGLGGTSMAAPFVTGTIALMMEADPALRAGPHLEGPGENTKRVREILKQSAQPHPDYGASEQGAGLLRVDEALEATGTGDTRLRPSIYATPAMLVVGGTWIVYRRRGRGGESTRRALPGRSGPEEAALAAHSRSPATNSPRTARPRIEDHDDPRPRSVGFDQQETPLPLEGPHGPAKTETHRPTDGDPFAPPPSARAKPPALPGPLFDAPREAGRFQPPLRHDTGTRRTHAPSRMPGRPYSDGHPQAKRPVRRTARTDPPRDEPVPPWSLKSRRNPDPAQAPEEDTRRSGPERRWRQLRWD